MKFIIFFFLFSLVHRISSYEISERFIKDVEKLTFNEDGRLMYNYVLFPDQASESCQQKYSAYHNDHRMKVTVSKNFVDDIIEKAFQISPENNEDGEGCSAICLPIGLEKQFVNSPIVPHIAKNVQNVSKFIDKKCMKVDVGMINYSEDEIEVLWKRDNGDPIILRTLKPNGDHQLQGTYIGHTLVLRKKTDGSIIREYKVIENAYIPIGEYTLPEFPEGFDPIEDIQTALDNEFDKFQVVKRTFTEFGFQKGKLPRDIWGSMSTYYYNNRENESKEPWDLSKGLYVNWWEVPSYMVWIPQSIRDFWAHRLKLLVEEWVGLPLEATSMYGLRKYVDGARLLTHVDRLTTHAASMIVNVAQRNIRKPWTVEIYDFANRLHEVVMEEGDIVFYESARCLHGRMAPLQGEYYVNIFTHYRPIGDSNWYTRPRDKHCPEPVIDIGDCKVIDNKVACEKYDLPYLDPKAHKVVDRNSLFNYWLEVSPANVKSEL